MSVELKPGEWRMRNGDKAVIFARNPFDPDWFAGACEEYGITSWKHSGEFFRDCEATDEDIIAPWTEPTPKYRPYRADELERLRGVWLSSKLSSAELLVVGIDKKHSCVVLCGTGRTTKDLLGDYTHLDGTPCGVLENGGGT